MSGVVTVQIDGQTFTGSLRPTSPNADAALLERYKLDRWGFPTCRGEHRWMEKCPEPSQYPAEECTVCGETRNKNEGAA